jgi:hypothetical protein
MGGRRRGGHNPIFTARGMGRPPTESESSVIVRYRDGVSKPEINF